MGICGQMYDILIYANRNQNQEFAYFIFSAQCYKCKLIFFNSYRNNKI